MSLGVGSHPETLPEITAAAHFLSELLQRRLSPGQLQRFERAMRDTLTEHYRHHWFPDKPCRGSGYRCIRLNHRIDPIIGKVASRINMSSQHLFRHLPKELTLWVDPDEVSYRIGEDGSICVLYETPVTTARGPLNCKSELLGCSKPTNQYMMAVSG